MYRRYRIFQHPWPRILPIFTIKWKLKPSLVKLIKSFLQFCISHEFKIHFYLHLKSLSWDQLTATDVKLRLFSRPLPCPDWPPSLLLRSALIASLLASRCRMSPSLFVISNYVLHDTLTRLILCVDIGRVTIVHIPVSLAPEMRLHNWNISILLLRKGKV